MEKWVFRKAFEDRLPSEVVWRLKQEFSQGSGSAALLPKHFESLIPDEELAAAQQKHPKVRSKEELYYFRIFTEHFGEGRAVDTVGQWVSL
jgi:asparagine synthase (glutamine-hydrolysing)